MTHPNQEDAVKNFIQNIAQLAEKRQLTKETVPPICRSWSSANKNLPARGGDVNRKPDLVCTDPTIGVLDDWRHFHALVEIKSGKLSPRSVYLLLQEQAAVIFRHQDRRRFVLTFALIKHEMTIALFDRGGSVISPPFNIIDRPLLFLKVILGLSFASEDYLGYDTTIITRPSFRIINSRFLGRVTIHCTLFLADRMDGRGTIVWLAVLEGDVLTTALPKLIQSHFGWSSPSRHMSLPLVVKDAWIDEKNSVTEGMILALLNHKGVKGVPHIVAEERVPAPVPPGWTNEVSYPSDSTTLNRSRLKLPPGQLHLDETASKVATPAVAGYDPRAHVRSYMTPYAIPIFEFRSGVELLGVIADALTSHEQATLDHRCGPHESSVSTPSLFPFRILHRDPSSRNVGMVPHDKSDHIACPLRTKGEHRGLLYDWGCAAIAEVRAADRPAAVDEEDADTIITDEGYVLLPNESDADSGLLTATPELIDSFDDLVELVRQCIYEERPGLDITGTLPYMSVEMLDTSLSLDRADQDNKPTTVTTPMHEIRHDLEAFYMVLVSLCVLFEEPHRPKNLYHSRETAARLPRPHEVLPHAIIAWLTGQESYDEYALRDRFITFGTRVGFSSMILPSLSPYFEPMGPYLEMIHQLIYGDHEWHRGRYERPPTSPSHKEFLDILHSAMGEIPSNSPGFSEIRGPPVDFYLPISPSGVWKGGRFDWRDPIIRSNNAFGYFRSRSKAPSESVAMPPTPTTGGFLVVKPTTPAYTFVNCGPETFSNSSRNRHYKSRPSDLYLALPSVKRPGSTTNRPKKSSTKLGSPYQHFWRRHCLYRRWLDCASAGASIGKDILN